jgi:hypothetical protein
MRPVVTLRTLVLLFVVCLLVSALVVIFLVSKYEKPEKSLEIQVPVAKINPVAVDLPVPEISVAPKTEKPRDSNTGNDSPEREPAVKKGEPLLY